jgi:NAD(P)-dependent dehydrogenase (short-subunit alcohol dehydrogenase family)
MADRNLLVFGARNLGRELCERLAAEGWGTAAVARSEETIARLPSETVGMVADAAKGDEAERVFAEVRERLGPLDLVVNAITVRPRNGFGGGPIAEASAEAIEPHFQELVPAIFNIVRLGCRALLEHGAGTLVQLTGGSSRRGMPKRGPWTMGAFATRGLVQSAAAEMRGQGVHVALLIVDATIESEKTAAELEGKPSEASASQAEIVHAIDYLAGQSPRGWTHELQLTPSGETWVP